MESRLAGEDVQLAADAWEAEMTIPFASLGQTPNPNESWQARFVRHDGGRQTATAVFPDENGLAAVQFRGPHRPRRCSGGPAHRTGKAGGTRRMVQDFTEIGWQIHLVTSGEKLLTTGDPLRRLLVPPSPRSEQGPGRLLAEAPGAGGQATARWRSSSPTGTSRWTSISTIRR